MRTVQIHPPARVHAPHRAAALRGQALSQFATRQAHERPLVIAGSLLALGLIPVAAFASRKALTRRQHDAASAIELPRNLEWYPWG